MKMNKITTFLSNLKSFHHRIMMRYLRKRGWVVFYLEEQCRKPCSDEGCFLNLYYAALKQEEKPCCDSPSKEKCDQC
jgi:hypothetical protein